MIEITRKEECCGCSACSQTCPKSCISMTSDNEGFLYPHVDTSICINCGLCEKVCNILHPREERKPLNVLAAINNDDNVRMKSSSGGIFHILAERTIKKGGVIFGARLDESWQVVFDYAETLADVEPFMGSKYVQAKVGSAYKTAKRFLDEGKDVLFSGTPCQIAGLHQYLRKDYPNLLAVDFVCHGVPSPKVWGKYLDGIQQNLKQIGGIEFKNKGRGWSNFSFKVSAEPDTCSLFIPFNKSHYMKAFLSDIILRPSCYECRSKGGRSLSDITLADFWGISSVAPEMNDDKGTSMVFINTEKGKAVLDFNAFRHEETTYERVKPLNPACFRSPARPAKRDYFFKMLDSTEDMIALNALIDRCTRPSVKKRLVWAYYSLRQIAKKFIIFIIRGGQKTNSTYTYTIARMPQNPKITGLCFRDKSGGWQSYGMVLQIKKSER